MDKNDMKEIMCRISQQFGAKVVEEIQQHEQDLYDEGFEDGKQFQKKEDMHAAVDAFLDLKAKDEDVYRYLSTNFKMDSINDASKIIRNVKLRRQIKALRLLFEKDDVSNDQFRCYIEEKKIKERLFSDDSLLNMSPERLKEKLDKE